MNLDLRITRRWLGFMGTVVRQLPYIRKAKILKRFSPSAMYADTLSYIDDTATLGDRPFMIEDDLDYLLQEKFTTIKGFHSTRITDERSFTSKGIRRISRDLLETLALERFAAHASTESIKRACGLQEISQDDQGVFFFADDVAAKKVGQNHYLTSGSETLQGLAIRLGVGSRGILAKQGRACLIECDIPLRVVTKTDRLCIWKEMLTYYFKREAGGRPFRTSSEIAFRCDDDIPADKIRRFDYIDSTILESTSQKH